LGANIGSKRHNLIGAVSLITERVGCVLALSCFYETKPWGFGSSEDFLNMAVKAETELSPPELLAETQQIERDLGRTGKTVQAKYEDRIIDIDILLYDDLIMNAPNLVIPHPLLHLREFVLEPLKEIAPYAIHPVFQKPVKVLYEILMTPSYEY
jgi:2-amino-4-hydroxy-6-hydroxymethyldihydropteridine diphosphokinase